MSFMPPCFLYTQDADFARSTEAYLGSIATLRHIEDPRRLEVQLQQFDPSVVILDLMADESQELFERIQSDIPNTAVIAMGEPNSAPFIEADAMGAYAVETYSVKRQRLKSIVSRALAHVNLVQENRLLKEEGGTAAPAALPAQPVQRAVREPILIPTHLFAQAYRQIDNVDRLLDNMVDGVATCARISRVAIFASSRDPGRYSFRAGINCLEDVRGLEVTEDDPLVRWLRLNAHIVSMSTISHVKSATERMLLLNCLKAMGAEVLIPLHGRDRLLGWIAVGHHVTGVPFDQLDLEDLMRVAEHIAITLENAFLYEEVAVQKTLAETVLHSIPVGIVAVNSDSEIRWFNNAAEAILAVPVRHVMNKSVSQLGGRFPEILSRCVRGEALSEPWEWDHTRTKRAISVTVRRLDSKGHCLGAVAIVRDVTAERMIEEQKNQLEHATFWTEFAAAMSHEVRNPLVAVSTFAQLLPERYDDEEFRDKFSDLVAKEISRLNTMLDQIDAFANPRAISHVAVNLDVVLEKAINQAIKSGPPLDGLEIEIADGGRGLKVEGDEAALVECFAHIIVNAIEALEGEAAPRVRISAKPFNDSNVRNGVVVNVQDNGSGLSEEVRDKLYSPFCTTKPRGIGLGLPIVRRTIIDHNGRINVESGGYDTNVTVILPSAETTGGEE